MKKVVVMLGALIFSSICYSQDSYLGILAGVDARNAILGSRPTGNKPALDGMIQLAAVGQNFEITVAYESFSKIKYSRIGFGPGYHFPLYGYLFDKQIKTTVIPNIEISMIYRKQNENYHISETYDPRFDYGTVSFVALTYNGSVQWDLTDNLMLQLTGQLMKRPDLVAAYDDKRLKGAGYIKLGWKFN